MTRMRNILVFTAAVVLGGITVASVAEARRGGGARHAGGGHHANVNRNINRNANFNRNANLNRNANINRNINRNANVNRNINRNANVNRNVNRNANINRNVNRNANTNRNVNRNVNVNRNAVNVAGRGVVRGWTARPYFGTAVGGVVLGSIIAATAVGAVPASPDPNVCWFWTDDTRTQGYWAYCNEPKE